MNAYEIRNEILKQATDLVLGDFHSKFQIWETQYATETEAGNGVTVDKPRYPELGEILSVAERMNNFVTGN